MNADQRARLREWLEEAERREGVSRYSSSDPGCPGRLRLAMDALDAAERELAAVREILYNVDPVMWGESNIRDVPLPELARSVAGKVEAVSGLHSEAERRAEAAEAERDALKAKMCYTDGRGCRMQERVREFSKSANEPGDETDDALAHPQ